ncbi:hypothetical protein LOC67_00095 [Stieleria sp. JC731]|uniref:hypothetical protein n=1 Tax=Pirellulaceae TaxID=2691357 RepID=UPI001E3FD333|nr:hypothetical protein [Stieleria sp. JC731]MCC9598939.1 hypothetical protein [Stieleria sp. JC731]
MLIVHRTLFLLVAIAIGSIATDVNAQTNDPFGAPDDPFGRSQDPFDPTEVSKPASIADLNKQARPQSKASEVVSVRSSIDDAKFSSDSERRIRAALNDETSQTFIQTPLSDAARALSSSHKIPIVLNLRALEEIGLDADVPVTIDLRNVKLRSFLRLMLSDLDMAYLVKDDVLQLTTVEAAEGNLTVEIYTLEGSLAERGAEVTKAITSVIVPDIWEGVGGPASAISIDHVIIVSATSDVHHQVDLFLSKLAAAYGAGTTAAVRQTGGH